MDKSFKVYVDLFGNEEGVNSTILENSDEQRLASYDVVTATDITGVDAAQSGEQSMFSPQSCDKPGSSQSGQDSPSKVKLCGYLKVHKPGDKMQKRRRWFVFSEEMCRLLYFRAPQDMIPRCDIDIACASFSVQEPSSDGTLNRFEIR